ncbi:MAG: META domain-containing protein [Thermomicrobiales bacterium]
MRLKTTRRATLGMAMAAGFAAKGLATALAADATPVVDPPPAMPPVGSTWRLVVIERSNGKTFRPADQLAYTLRLTEDGRVEAGVDCNTGAGRYTMDGSSLILSPIATTKMACLTDDPVAAAYAMDLGNVTSFVIRNDDLYLATKADGGTLRLARAFVDVVWEWRQGKDAGGAALTPDDPAKYTVEFARDGRIAVRTDCNRGVGRWTEAAGRIAAGPIGLTRMGCGPASLDVKFATALGTTLAYELRGGRLLLTSPDGGTLEFAAQPASSSGTPEA